MQAWDEVLIAFAVPICLVNLIFVIHVYHRRSLNKLQNALLLSLGCSNFSAGFFAIPCVLLCTLIKPRPCGICIASYLLNKFVVNLSFVHLTAVILERYLKIVHPFWFLKKEFTLLRSHRVVFVLWFTSLLLASTPLTWWLLENPCRPTETLTRNLRYFDYACLALFIILLVIMIYAFVRIFLVVRVHLLQMNLIVMQLQSSPSGSLADSRLPSVELANNNVDKSLPESTRSLQRETAVSRLSLQSTRQQVLLKEARVVIRFAAMVLMFVLVWGPYFYVSTQDAERDDMPDLVKKIVAVLRFMNPLIDPCVLTFNKIHLRKLCRLISFFYPSVLFRSR